MMGRRKDENWYSSTTVLRNLRPYVTQIPGMGITINGFHLNKRNDSYIRSLQEGRVMASSQRRLEELLTDCELQPSPILALMRPIKL